MTAIFSSKSLATAAANAAGFLQGEYTVSKAEGGWTYEAKEAAPTLALAQPVASEEVAPQGEAPEAASVPQESPATVVRKLLPVPSLVGVLSGFSEEFAAFRHGQFATANDELDTELLHAFKNWQDFTKEFLEVDADTTSNNGDTICMIDVKRLEYCAILDACIPNTMQGMAAMAQFAYATACTMHDEGAVHSGEEPADLNAVSGTDKALWAFIHAVRQMPKGMKFPTAEHAVAWAKLDGFAKNRIVVEPVEGGFLFRPLGEGEKYVALGTTPRTGNGPAFPAVGTKKRILIDMVCRKEGASMEELETAVGWKKCSGTLNELDEAFGLDIEYRKKGKVGRYYGTFPAAYAPASAEPEATPAADKAEPEAVAA